MPSFPSHSNENTSGLRPLHPIGVPPSWAAFRGPSCEERRPSAGAVARSQLERNLRSDWNPSAAAPNGTARAWERLDGPFFYRRPGTGGPVRTDVRPVKAAWQVWSLWSNRKKPSMDSPPHGCKYRMYGRTARMGDPIDRELGPVLSSLHPSHIGGCRPSLPSPGSMGAFPVEGVSYREQTARSTR